MECGRVGVVGAVGADVLLIGPDLDERLPQPGVALGLFQAGPDLVSQGIDLVVRPLTLGPLQRRQGLTPGGGVVDVAACLIAQRLRFGQHLRTARPVVGAAGASM